MEFLRVVFFLHSFFSLAIDILDAQFHNSIFVKYVDDICLLHFLRHDEDNHLSEQFEDVVAWSSEHGLSINRDKT